MTSYWLGKGSAECRNYDGDFEISSVKYSDCVHHCTKSIFIRKHILTGEVIDLNWLLLRSHRQSILFRL